MLYKFNEKWYLKRKLTLNYLYINAGVTFCIGLNIICKSKTKQLCHTMKILYASIKRF